MKKKFIIFLIILLTCTLSSVFAKTELKKRVIVSVKAISNGEEKRITSRINGKTIENKIKVDIVRDKDGNIEIISKSFRLGKMPFTSKFYFSLNKKDIPLNKKNEYIVKKAKGYFKVLATKKESFLEGFFNEDHGKLILTSKRKDKTLTMEMIY